MKTGLRCITNIVEGFMTVDPFIIVSEPVAVIMGDAARALETTATKAGIITQIPLININLKGILNFAPSLAEKLPILINR